MSNERAMTNKAPSVEDIADDWLQRLQAPDCSPNDRKQFEYWYRGKTEHSQAFTEAQQLETQIAALTEQPGIAALRKKAHTSTKGYFLRTDWLKKYLPNNSTAILASATTCLALIALCGILILSLTTTAYKTSVGQQRIINLEDGTQVILDTATHVEVDYREHRRQVILRQGQAYFSVAPQTRPFIVEAGNGQITALGTAFAVRTNERQFSVTLEKGKVSVMTTNTHNDPLPAELLLPGEKLDYSPERGVEKTTLKDPTTETSWIKGHLIFESTKLVDAIAEVNRYTEKKIHINSLTLQNIMINGRFDIGDTEAFLLALESTLNIQQVHRINGSIELTDNTKK